VPLIVPIAAHYGVNPYHLGIVFLLNLEIGYLTPPVGLNLFISSFRFKQPVTKLYRSVLPFIGLLLIAVIVTTYWEPLSTYLTRLSGATEISTEEIEGSAPTPEGENPDELDQRGGETLDDLDADADAGVDRPHPGETLDDL
jgi:hypothetical protein